jgi:hypothetical protein
MSCKKVLNILSEYYDEELDADMAFQVSQHLAQCPMCREEYDRLSALHSRLQSLEKIQAPEYLRHLVQLHLTHGRQDPLHTRILNDLQNRWAKIRTTGRMWYLTRAMGTIMATVFFLLISSAITPFHLNADSPLAERTTYPPECRQKVMESVVRKLGMVSFQAQNRSADQTEPMINDLVLLQYGESVAQEGADDTFSVAYMVDTNWTAKMESILEHPIDRALLKSFNEKITSARCRPASKNGHTVAAFLVFTFSKISVHD